jgi:hypothetical protein
MEKYVSFRIEKTANERVIGQINHDMRIGKIPSYINKKKSNENYLIYGNKLNKTTYQDLLKDQNTRSKRKIQKNTERFFKGIMTFDEKMTEDYKNNPELFNKCARDFIKKLQAEGIQITYAELHLDEKTPHIHLLFDNIDKNTGKSIRRTINPKKLSEMQDMMGQSFEKMGYQRGKPKTETMANHFDFKDYHKLEQELTKLKQKIKNQKATKIDEKLEQIWQQIETGEGKLDRNDFDYLVKNMGFFRRFSKDKEVNKQINKIMEKGFKISR